LTLLVKKEKLDQLEKQDLRESRESREFKEKKVMLGRKDPEVLRATKAIRATGEIRA
jgi:hypothetical protein